MIRALLFSLTIYFISVQVISLNVTESKFTSFNKNATDHASWKSRSKRALFDEMQSELKITVRYVTGEEVDLVYKKVPQYLANENLPIVTSEEYYNLKLVDQIGNFVLYHDLSKCSAVVYFENFKTLYGVIGMDYYIRDLPFDFDEDGNYQSGVVGEPYVKSNQHSPNHIHPNDVYPPPSDADSWYDFLRPPTDRSNQSFKRPSDSDAGPSTKRQRPDENPANADGDGTFTYLVDPPNTAVQHYYVETLIFVARDIADLFKNIFSEERYIKWILRHLIIYFNTVDMMLQKTAITSAKVHMNIAKIVIETDLMRLDFMSDPQVQFDNVVRNSRRHLRSHWHEFAPDSFDHVFIHTSRKILDGTVEINGLTRYGEDLYEARKNSEYFNVVPITLVRFQYYYKDYVVAVHEMGRVLHMKIDPGNEGLLPIGQCNGIMQRGGPQCNNCLKWSDDSQNRLGVFLRENRNRCFLLNEPRSLRPPGASTFLRAATQCECFGYHSHVKYPSGLVVNLVGFEQCTQPLLCQIGQGAGSSHVATVIPLDGTPCSSNKVCWKKRCMIIRNRRWPNIQHSC